MAEQTQTKCCGIIHRSWNMTSVHSCLYIHWCEPGFHEAVISQLWSWFPTFPGDLHMGRIPLAMNPLFQHCSSTNLTWNIQFAFPKRTLRCWNNKYRKGGVWPHLGYFHKLKEERGRVKKISGFDKDLRYTLKKIQIRVDCDGSLMS